MNASRFRAAAAFAGTGANEFALELGEAAKHCQHKPSVRGCRVRPCIGERAESGSGLRYGVQRVEKVARRSGQPVEARHQQHVALAERREGAAKLGAVGLRAARRLLEHLLGSGGAKRLHLSINALAIRRDAGISENRHADRVGKRLTFATNFCTSQSPDFHVTLIDKWHGFLIAIWHHARQAFCFRYS